MVTSLRIKISSILLLHLLEISYSTCPSERDSFREEPAYPRHREKQIPHRLKPVWNDKLVSSARSTDARCLNSEVLLFIHSRCFAELESRGGRERATLRRVSIEELQSVQARGIEVVVDVFAKVVVNVGVSHS